VTGVTGSQQGAIEWQCHPTPTAAGQDVRPYRDRPCGRHGQCMALTRLRMDELVNAWVADRYTPFQIALLGVFDAAPFLLPDGAVDVPRIRRELIARAGRVEAFRRRVVWTRFGEGMPVWAPDPSFDPERHIERASLPAGADLATWAADRIVRPLPLDRPLWRAEVVDGLPGERFALIVVVHHVAADGLTGVSLAGSLLDGTPDAASTDTAVPEAPPLPSHADLIRDRLGGLAAALRRARPPSGAGFRRLRALLRQFRDASADLRTRTSETSLPRRVGPTRRLVVVRAPLDDLRRAGHALGATVNDLLLASVTGGLRALLSARGDDIASLTLRTSVPAATGAGHQASGIMLVDLPVAEPDPLRRLATISAATSRAKGRLYAGAGDITEVVHLPIPLAHIGMRWMRRFGGTRVNLFVTDVPGPTTPLWLAGARMLEAVPVAPLVQHVGLGVAALSYAGELAVSVHADGSVADLELLANGMAADFAAFRAAAPTAVPAESAS
jgi:diacylglycerol O-acyltransferase / wax synthase